ncbi:NAD(P)/FAD-dependent oxidoreductase [Flavobacterium rhizosphaerae]|uniref:NAD(P)/FAD-dependent oxidoreductase n=1 Tax=Flavobacterium rhizosphaerae TaxID=3163298 RepID=A0ABW8YTR5_9FLAO
MEEKDLYDVIIIGGSYAGLSAALALGRSLRYVLVIDSGNPCNKLAPHSHNFITNDGVTPTELHNHAKEQVLAYPSVTFIEGLATAVEPKNNTFIVATESGDNYISRKILFATGITDTLPITPGFSDCWGKSILHCPYCHGYEAKGKKTAVIGNGDTGYEMAKTIRQWTANLTLFTNGTSTLTPEETLKLNTFNITVVENTISAIEEENGYVKKVLFEDATPEFPEVIYTQLPFIQQCSIPEDLGVEFTDKGFIYVSKYMETSLPGVYAAGDCLSLFRSVAHAVSSGNKAGAIINKKLIEEQFA